MLYGRQTDRQADIRSIERKEMKFLDEKTPNSMTSYQIT